MNQRLLLFTLSLGLALFVDTSSSCAIGRAEKDVFVSEPMPRFSNHIFSDYGAGFQSTYVKKKPSGKKQGRHGPGFFDMEINKFNLDIFAGPSYNMASGDYIEYQKLYYETGSSTFKGSGSFQNFFSFNLGLQGRIYPADKDQGIMGQISVAFGLMYLKKGFSHDVSFQNTGSDIKYYDETKIKESYKANFLGTQLTVRIGRKIYAEGGITFDWFLNGIKTFDLVRSTTNSDVDTAYIGEFSTGGAVKSNLTGSTMATGGLGWVFGVGYQVAPFAGIRFFNTINSNFFKEGKLSNYQPSLQLIFTLN